MTPCRGESELKGVLTKVCPDALLEDSTVHHYYMMLASLIGGWLSEQSRLETSPVKNALLTMAKNLSQASALLSGLETGIRSNLETEITSRILNLLAMNPAIGSPESALVMLGALRQDADTVSHACLIAAFDLPSGPEKRGQKKKEWYTSFTKLLLTIAEDAGIRPTLYKDRHPDHESLNGWLLDAARELETFLPVEMRSPSDVARYKRLERSKARLREAQRRNFPSG